MKKLIVAFANDDGKNFINRHFGDADYYDIYQIDTQKVEFIKRIPNQIEEEEEVHADPRKAKGISALLLQENVSVVVSRVFGPNIKRIRKKFVCVISKDKLIENGLRRVFENIDIIIKELEKGEERQHLNL